MSKQIVRPIGLLHRLADTLMIPLMYLISGTLEEPQRTHKWNNVRFPERIDLDHSKMVDFAGTEALPMYWLFLPLCHLPIFGGWRDYVVLEPVNYGGEWHVGWKTPDIMGASRVPVIGPVRVLIGKLDVSFFGLSAGENIQLKLRHLGSGKIGDGGPYKNLPFL